MGVSVAKELGGRVSDAGGAEQRDVPVRVTAEPVVFHAEYFVC
jgi:hypothetical protein